MRSLIVLVDGKAHERPLPQTGAITVGRGADATITIDHASLSRRHVKLTLGKWVTVEDCGSRNGVAVAGRDLGTNESVVAMPGVAIEAGDALLLVRSPDAPDLIASHGMTGGVKGLDKVLTHIAKSGLPVLLYGEPGAGKAFLAAKLHQASARPAIETLECGPDVTGEQVEALIAKAAGATLVIREPSALNVEAQGELDLTTVHPITLSSKWRPGGGVTILVPPLRDRTPEINALAEGILAELSTQAGHSPPMVTSDARSLLEKHAWSGNVRELREVLTRALQRGATRVIAASQLDV